MTRMDPRVALALALIAVLAILVGANQAMDQQAKQEQQRHDYETSQHGNPWRTP